VVKSRSSRTVLVIFLLVLTAWGCTSKKEKVENFISRGDALMQQGDPVRAVLEYKNALQLDPRNARAALLIGRAYLAEKKYKNAFAAFSRAVSIDPGFDQARLEKASLLIAARQGEKALKEIEKIKSPEKLEPRVSILKAKAMIISKRYADAVDLLSGKDGKTADVPMLLSICYRETGRHEEMKEAVRKWRSLDPKGPGSYLFMAQYYAQTGDKEGVSRQLSEMVKAKPSDAGLKLVQASLLERIGMVKEAEAVYEKLPSQPRMMRARADFYLRHRRAQDAEAVLKEILEKNPGDIDSALDLSRVLAVRGRIDEAYHVLDRIKQQDLAMRDWERVLLARAGLKAAEGRFEEARSLCREILKKDQGMAEAHLLLGRILLAGGKLDKAEVHLNQAAAASPGNAEAQILLARCQLLNKKPSMAGDTLKNALKRNPASEKIRMSLVRYNLMKKDYASAMEVLKEGLDVNKKDLLFLKVAGEIEAMRKRYPEAQEYFQRILKLQPDSPTGPMEMGRLMLVRNRQDEAIKWFRRAYRAKGGWKTAVPALVETYIRSKDVDSALELVRKEVEKRPEAALMQYLLGRLLAMKGEMNEAEMAYSRAIESAPRWPQPYQGLASLYVQQNKIAEAVSRMERLYRESPSFSAGMSLAILYEYNDDYKQAVETYKSLLKRFGSSPVVRNNVAYLYAEHSKDKKELEAARNMIQEVLARHPGDANFLDTAGWIEYRLGRVDAAWAYLQDAVSKAPDTGIIQLHCAVVSRDLGHEEEADAYLEKALRQKLDPQARKQAMALKRKWE